ncbi:hypothetical protein B0I35DRAFT_439598 [Stachybotrys elegans]|uniref:Uncharacterized protein n=1 Tax=Stachybotrys elegans TaxID=80388 RepID=A0A8K0SKG4_9HYPO|nr:hypothetical protein B0I35DRAFT_439598 [Stachybotrys elegans]
MKFTAFLVVAASAGVFAIDQAKRNEPVRDLRTLKYANSVPVAKVAKVAVERRDEFKPTKDNRNLEYENGVPLDMRKIAKESS